MGSLLLVLFVMGVALPRVDSSSMPEAESVPKPEVIGVGYRTVNVTLTTNIDYKLCQDGSSCKEFFTFQRILIYSEPIGDIDFNSVTTGKTANDSLVYMFPVQNADCEAVRMWMNQIVLSTSVFVSANVQCSLNPLPTLMSSLPVDKPTVHGRGFRTASVALTTETEYKVCEQNRSSCELFFIKSKIWEYSKAIGDVGNIGEFLISKTTDNVLAYLFSIFNTDCKAERHSFTVMLYTNIGYEACKRDTSACMRFFNDTKIPEYLKPLVDFPRQYTYPQASAEDDLVYSLNFVNADCKTMKLWMNQIVPSSPVYKSADVRCFGPFPPQPPSLEIKPVPKPAEELIGKGSDLVLVEIHTTVWYTVGSSYPDYHIDEYFSYFDLTKIKEYTQLLGELGILELISSDNYLVYRLEIRKTVCEKVALWLKEIVNSSSFYKRINTSGENGLDCTYLITDNACRLE
ncbi:hypothetical protein COOONC_22472 [Cooperia oncophora]